MVGYDYCNYADCLWSSGHYVQLQSACDPKTLKYTITYQLLPGSTCIRNPAVAPPASISIDCTSASSDSYLGKLATALSIIGMVSMILVGTFAAIYRKEAVIRKSQPIFVYLSIFGAFLMNLSILAFVGPNTNGACVLRPWALDLSSTIMFSPLLMKLHRLDVVVRMSKKLKKVKIPDYYVALQVRLASAPYLGPLSRPYLTYQLTARPLRPSAGVRPLLRGRLYPHHLDYGADPEAVPNDVAVRRQRPPAADPVRRVQHDPLLAHGVRHGRLEGLPDRGRRVQGAHTLCVCYIHHATTHSLAALVIYPTTPSALSPRTSSLNATCRPSQHGTTPRMSQR